MISESKGQNKSAEQFADIKVDRVNIQMEAEDADRTEI